jgi:hypothetical protein
MDATWPSLPRNPHPAKPRRCTKHRDRRIYHAGGHQLEGLHYDRMIGPTDAASRITRLKRQRTDQLDDEDWAPQPWEQLIKVLRDMGHPTEAAEIAMEKQRMMRAARRIGTREANTRFRYKWRRALHKPWTRFSNWSARKFHDF